MIRYALCCDEGHRFDSWFYDSSAFDQQAARGLVTCPTCDSHHVVKAIMAPAVVANQRRVPPTVPLEPSATAEPAQPNRPLNTDLLDHDRRQLVRAIRDKVVAGSRDVGRSFAVEARRIHDDASEERIRGQATLDEARNLLEDGIMVLPVPTIPDDLN